MARTELEIHNEHGLHARPAAIFVQTAARFKSRITLENLARAGKTVDAKSIMSVLTAGVHRGSHIILEADGPDADEAIAALTAVIASGLGDNRPAR